MRGVALGVRLDGPIACTGRAGRGAGTGSGRARTDQRCRAGGRAGRHWGGL